MDRFDPQQLLNTPIGRIEIPGRHLGYRIEDASNCKGMECHEAWATDGGEIVSPGPHSHLLASTDTGVDDVALIAKD